MQTDEQVLEVLAECAGSVAEALKLVTDWGLAGTRPGQHWSDLSADRAGVPVLVDAGFAVLSEESGWHGRGGSLVAVLDPLDGSTNAERGLPWYATSICVLDEAGPWVALVRNQVSGRVYSAVRSKGAWRDGSAIRTSGCLSLAGAVVAFSGYPERHLGWSQYRSLGAAALDLCAVADGTLDGFATAGGSRLHAWDYLGGWLVLREAGASVRLEGEDGAGEFTRDGLLQRRMVTAGASPSLLAGIEAALS